MGCRTTSPFAAGSCYHERLIAMSDFEKALQAILQDVSEECQRANADLHQEVAAASESLSRLTGGAARLVLSAEEETNSETVYSLILEILRPKATATSGVPGGTTTPVRSGEGLPWDVIEMRGLPEGGTAPTTYELAKLHVSSSGYPINSANNTISMQNRKDIAAFLTDLANRKDSPLVLYLRFHFRRQAQKPT